MLNLAASFIDVGVNHEANDPRHGMLNIHFYEAHQRNIPEAKFSGSKCSSAVERNRCSRSSVSI
jgi:hypothetical protein